MLSARIPEPLAKRVQDEKVNHHRPVQVTVQLALEHYFALPVGQRLQLTIKTKGGVNERTR